MFSVNKKAILPYLPIEMFDLVNDVGAYQEFLPWCDGTTIDFETPTEMQASIVVKRAGIVKSLTTRNTLDRPHTIALHLIDGPFTSFEGLWKFIDIENQACEISLKINFDIASLLAKKMLTPIFGEICRSMLQNFIDRAEKVYGKRKL
jgi:ribosome-associated toxin RatA of RatAB toxin-antitoxin module